MSTPETIEVVITPAPEVSGVETVVIPETTPVEKLEEVAAIVEAVADLIPQDEVEKLRGEMHTLHARVEALESDNAALRQDIAALAVIQITESAEEELPEETPAELVEEKVTEVNPPTVRTKKGRGFV